MVEVGTEEVPPPITDYPVKFFSLFFSLLFSKAAHNFLGFNTKPICSWLITITML